MHMCFHINRRCFSALMIAKQPFPKSIKQNIKTSTAVDDPVVVRLFAPAKIEVYVLVCPLRVCVRMSVFLCTCVIPWFSCEYV